MARLILALTTIVMTTPALAWEAGQEGAICTLAHSEAGAEILLTHDPAGPRYTITVTRPEPWPEAPVFGITFLGGEEITITTDRHILSDDGRTLSVADRGFGNLLAGLSRNRVATLSAGSAAVNVSLDGAAPEVAAFEACGAAPSV